MADKTGIEWADATWNPLVGCTKVSPGCDHCYAEELVNRFAGTSPAFPTAFSTVNIREDKFLLQPFRWRDPRKVFVNSLSDLFHADVPDSFIARVFAVMAATPRHTYQLLTKRHARPRSLLARPEFHDLYDLELRELMMRGVISEKACSDAPQLPLPNLWLGVSVEDQHWADIRIPALLDTPAAVRWISAEPLLGPVTLTDYLRPWKVAAGTANAKPRLDWVVVGGESGRGARAMDRNWARDLRDECKRAGVPFLFKQWGSHDEEGTKMHKHDAGRVLDGTLHDGYPA